MNEGSEGKTVHEGEVQDIEPTSPIMSLLPATKIYARTVLERILIKRYLVEYTKPIMNALEKLAKPKYIGIDGLAKMLGVSKSTAYKISASGELPRYRANGKIVRFARADVIAYMEKNRIKSNDEIELEANSYLENAGSRSGNRPAVRHN